VGATCPAAGQQPVAQQTFGAAGASTGAVQFAVNTAAFRVASDWSSATVDFANGQQTLVATLTTSGSASSANSNLTVLNLTNTDGWAARHTAPARSARNTTTGDLWHGGPAADGRGSVSIVPVTYTPNRSVTAASFDMSAAAGCTAGGTAGAIPVTATTARPWSFSYGTSLGTATGANANNIVCNNASAALDVVPRVASATDNNNVAYPTTFLATSTGTVAVTVPAAIRGDWQVPATPTYTLYAPTNGLAGWVNASFKFDSSANITGTTDNAGVGLDVANYQYETAGCPVPSTIVWTAMGSDKTGNAIAECASDFSNAAYRVRMRSTDRLGNLSAYATTQSFGVDKTAPLIRYSSTSDTTGTIRSTAGTTYMTAQVLDERAGFEATAAQHFIARIRRSVAVGATRADTNCVVGTTGTFGSTPISAPGCSFAAAGALGTAGTDGYRDVPAFNNAAIAASGQGYYTYNARVVDRAGNSATLGRRTILIDATAPTGTSAIPLMAAGTITGAYATPFDGIYTDEVETRTTSFGLRFGGDTLFFPASLTNHVSFDDVISRDSTVSQTTPFTSGTRFYTDLEATGAGDAPGGSTTAVSGVGLSATNFAGLTGVAFTDFTGQVTADAVTWTAKVASLSAFLMTNSDAANNSPAGGLKARAVGTSALTNSPFARVDFYRRAASNRWEYIGSVDGTTSTACTSSSQTCALYAADNGATRAWTYVLRTNGVNSTTGGAIALNNGTYRAVGVTGTAGRGLMTANSAAFAPPPPAP
jgi:hypothetical protein